MPDGSYFSGTRVVQEASTCSFRNLRMHGSGGRWDLDEEKNRYYGYRCTPDVNPDIEPSRKTSTLQLQAFKVQSRDFPGGPVVKTLRFHCRGHGFDPWSGN